MNCIVASNCRNKGLYDCDFCLKYGYYNPIDGKIKSPTQIQAMVECREERKAKKHYNASVRGRNNRRNGLASDRELRKLIASWGVECGKVPLSGALKTEFIVSVDGEDKAISLKADVWAKFHGKQYKIENKRKENAIVWYRMVAEGIWHIEGFCYMMPQQAFRDIAVTGTKGNGWDKQTIEDRGFKTLHNYFNQDNVEIVTIKRPYNGYIFCVREDVYEEWMKS